jgi:hypothetical protein
VFPPGDPVGPAPSCPPPLSLAVVAPVATSLNSGDCFVLSAIGEYCIIWLGSASSPQEQESAAGVAAFVNPIVRTPACMWPLHFLSTPPTAGARFVWCCRAQARCFFRRTTVRCTC